MKRPNRSTIAAVCVTALFALSVSELATPEQADAQMRGAHRRGGAHRGGGPGGRGGPGARSGGPGRVGGPSSRHAYRAGARHGYHAGARHGWAHHAPTLWRWHPVGWGLAVLATTAIVVAIVSDDGGTQSTTSAASASNSDPPGTIYYDQGSYYQKQADGSYKVVPAPGGATLSDLPQGYTSVWVANDQFFYYQGEYYVEKDGKYVLAAAPVGAAVPYLPDDAEEQTQGGTTYYVWQNEWYVEVSQNGETQYMLTKVVSRQASRLNPATDAAPEVAARASPGSPLGHLRQRPLHGSAVRRISVPA